MNFFWGDSERNGGDGSNRGSVVQTTSTFDLLSLPTSEAGAFYDQLNKEIEGLRAKVDNQLRDMVEASRKDITVLENKLKEIQSGEDSSTFTSTASKYETSVSGMSMMSGPLTSADSNMTEPVANLSRASRSRTRDAALSPSEEAKLLGIVKIGTVPEGREDDENDENEHSVQVDSQDRILQTRTHPDKTATNDFGEPSAGQSSAWKPGAVDGLVEMDTRDDWKDGATVSRQESAVDAIDKARNARFTPTSHYLQPAKQHGRGQ